VSVSDPPYPGNALLRPEPLASDAEGIALWWCRLDPDDDVYAELARWLAPAEHARAARYGRPALARRYVAGRAALRWVLALRAGVAPARVSIERGERGRPYARDAGVDFNVSNTRNVALIAVCERRDTRVGVDLEHADRQVDHAALARKFLTDRERNDVAALPDEDARRRAFLRLWTCKEAMSKATGDALSAPMRALDVEREPALRLVDGPGRYRPDDWRLYTARVPAPFIGTLAAWRPPAV
jgi:4'-phosphopantetheinyl transferase